MADVTEVPGRRCPRCGSTLLTRGGREWCSFVGAGRPGGAPPCTYGIDAAVMSSEADRPDELRFSRVSNPEFEPRGWSEDSAKYGRLFATKKEFHPGEPVFLLRATDFLAPEAIYTYALRCRAAGCPDEHVEACMAHAHRMKEWQAQNPGLVKKPD